MADNNLKRGDGLPPAMMRLVRELSRLPGISEKTASRLAFNLLNTTDAGGRRAQMHLPHQTVETPVFMPVGTAGSVKAVPQDIVESLGAQIILGNTYHLYLRPGHEAIRRMDGLHRFISWPRAMLTDSGGF